MRKSALAAALILALASCSSQPVRRHADNHGGRDWPGYGGDWTDAHYSPLTEINAGTVSQLGLAWSFDVEATPNAFSAPVAVDGVLYFGAGYTVLHAMDAATGKLLWQYDPKPWEKGGEKMRSAWGIRGIAYDNGKIYAGTIDGRLIAVDAKTGKLLWETMTVDPKDGRYISGPPWVANGKVLIGHGGADFAPVRGYVTAYDGESGKQLWRFFTVPGNPADGFENKAMEMAAKTWTGEWWTHGGGGTVWHAMSYDPQFNRFYIGTGNGAPWNQKIRSPGGGDNLFVCSIVALDADTGEYVWHYQINPGETWDYNAAMDITQTDLVIDGKKRPVLMTAPKNGFYYVIDRETGKLISAEKFVDGVTWASKIDLKTGRPVESPESRYPGGKPVLVSPNPTGAHAAEAMAFSPKSGFAYIPAIEQSKIYVDAPNLKDWTFPKGQMIANGTGVPPADMKLPPFKNYLLAWNPVTQKPAWKVPLIGAKAGGIMATGGNLVFQGNITGELVAYAGDSGKKLWAFNAQNGILAQPISYMAGGKQYVTVMTGWRQSGMSGTGYEWAYRQQKRRVLTFVLGGKGTLPPADRSMPAIMDDPKFVIDEAKAVAGEKTYGARCGVCHGGALKSGGAAPDLRAAPIPMDYESLRAVLQDGALISRGMPRYAEFSREQVAEIQHYIRREARKAKAEGR